MKRRGFLKQALVVIAASTVVPATLIRATEHIQKYHPEVQAVFDNFGDILEPHERRAIAEFVLAQIRSGNWDLMESIYHFTFEDEEKTKINWKG